jgi:O-antigen/teichoic acid export membrane protein
VFGSLIAVQQTLSYAALGMREGVLIRLSQPGSQSAELAIYSSAIAFAAAIGLVLPVATLAYGLASGGIVINYLLVALIGGMSIVNEVLVNLNRHEEKLGRVVLCESSYNVLILVLIFTLRDSISVPLALLYMLAGVSLSVAIYVARLRLFAFSAVRWSLTKELIGFGFLSSVLSALFIAINLLFVLLAQRHLPNSEVGQFVFANNVATMILVSLNAFSWAMTSRSLRALADRAESQRTAVARTDLFMRIGVAAALLAALAISIVLPWVTSSYEGSTRYILLLVALQSFQLLLFTEVNFLMARSRLRVLIAIFTATNLCNYLLIEASAGRYRFDTALTTGIVIVALAAVGVMAYARRAGLAGVSRRDKLTSMVLVVMAVPIFHLLGYALALPALAALALLLAYGQRQEIRTALGGLLRSGGLAK